MSDEKNKDGKFTIIKNDILRCEKLSTEARFLYCLISSYNPSFPSYSVLCEITGWARQRISKYLKELVSMGLIDYDKGNSSKKANLYRLNNLTDSASASSKLEPVKKKRTSSKLEPVEALTGSNLEPELVPNWNSNNTNIKKPMKNKKTNRPISLVLEILEFWNLQKIAVHNVTENLIQDLQRKVKKKNKSKEIILTAIKNYAEVFKGDEYYWTKKWTLEEFLMRDSASVFFSEAFDASTYLKHESKTGKIANMDNVIFPEFKPATWE